MKMRLVKRFFATIAIAILPVFILLTMNSCKKERNFETVNMNALMISQIVYKDLVPDTIRTATHTKLSDSYSIDLNNDAINDFTLIVRWSSGTRCGAAECSTTGSYSLSIITLDSNFVVDSLIPNIYSARPLNLNDLITKTSDTWQAGSSTILDRAGNPCCNSVYSWLKTGTIEKYLGLKLKKSPNTYYGWARIVVTVGIGASFTVKDYAYNSLPNQSILAGQTK